MMKKISSAIQNVIGETYDSTASISTIIRDSWVDIVGTQLSDTTELCKAHYIGKDRICVTINAISAAVPIAKYSANEISTKITTLTGIESVKLEFRHSCQIKTHISTMVPTQKLSKTIIPQKINEEFTNNSLKTALEQLKTDIKNAA